MLIDNLGSLKAELARYMFHQRFAPDYDTAVQNFEAVVNRRLRVLPMEHSVLLTTTNGDVPLPADYITWRTVRPTFPYTDPQVPTFHPPYDEIEYVHPAYLPPAGRGYDKLFTIEGNTFKVRPVDDRTNAYEFHYYRKIPTINGSDNNSNWLLLAHPDFYLEGALTELFALGRNAEGAQLHKARRDEIMQEIIQMYALTTGATSPRVRTAEYF